MRTRRRRRERNRLDVAHTIRKCVGAAQPRCAGAFLATPALMRITATLAGVLLLFGAACNQKTETTTTTDAAGNVQQQKTTTVTATVPSIDTTATAEAKQDVKAAAKDAANAARDAAHATGTAMETAGKEIQKRTKRH